MAESTEAQTVEAPKEKKPRNQYDPFENPGALAVEEAEWLNNEFPGLDIKPSHVRAVISHHARFQKSESRRANREKQAETLKVEREERKRRAEERRQAAEAKKAELEQKRAEREAAAAAKKAEKEAKAAEKAASADTEELKKAATGKTTTTIKRKPKPIVPEGEGF